MKFIGKQFHRTNAQISIEVGGMCVTIKYDRDQIEDGSRLNADEAFTNFLQNLEEEEKKGISKEKLEEIAERHDLCLYSIIDI